MAIKILSKNIYEINNPKVRDNLIDNVSVEQTIITPNNEYEVSVYNERISLDNLVREENLTKESFVRDVKNDDVSVWYDLGYVYFDNVSKYKESTITIPKLTGKDYISKIFTEKDEQGNSKIGVSIRGNIITQNTSSTVTVTKSLTSFTHSRGEITYSDKQTKTGQLIEFPQMPIEIKSPIIYGIETGASVVGILNKTNYAVSVWDDNENYYITYKILVYLLINQVNGGKVEVPDSFTNITFNVNGNYTEYNPEQLEITIYGNTIGIDLTDGSVTYGSGNKPYSLNGNELMQYEETINYAELISTIKGFSHNGDGLTIYGTEDYTLVVNGTCVDPTPETDRYFVNLGIVTLPKGKYYLKGMPKAVGLSALYLHDVENNMAIAESFYEPIEFYLEEDKSLIFYFVASNGDTFNNFIIAPEIININNSEYLANNILNQYSKGKETATLLCDISDYYDESGEKVIDITTNKMSFRLHDEVIPYIYGADGKDKPMSKNQDGSAKVFEVVGSNIIYDGAVWQELTLQEV